MTSSTQHPAAAGLDKHFPCGAPSQLACSVHAIVHGFNDHGHLETANWHTPRHLQSTVYTSISLQVNLLSGVCASNSMKGQNASVNSR